MPRKDAYHHIVRNALVKDGWTITHDPYTIPFGLTNVYADLGAEAPLAAERSGEKIAVEVKTFLGPSGITELERAIGQFVVYGILMGMSEPDRRLYVAMPYTAYRTIFDTADARELRAQSGIRLIVFDVEEEKIEQWIE